MGGDNAAHGAILATTDSGTTWTNQTLPAGITYVNRVACPSTTDCYVVADGPSGGAILKSTNSGGTWTGQTVPPGLTLNGIACPGLTDCEVVGGTSGAGSATGNSLGTVDGGTTWTSQTLPSGTGLLRGCRLHLDNHLPRGRLLYRWRRSDSGYSQRWYDVE